MDRGAWQTIVRGVAKSQTRLSDSLSLFTHFIQIRAEMPFPQVVKSLKSEGVLAAQLSTALWGLKGYSPLGSSVQGILQARILEWVAFPSPGDLSNPETEPRSSALQVDSLQSGPPGKRSRMTHMHRNLQKHWFTSLVLYSAALWDHLKS